MERLGFVEILLILMVSVVIAVFYLKNLQDTMLEVAPANRQVPAVNVWLMFIPLFNIVYGFILYPKICDSLRTEFEERGHPQPGDYCRALGLTMPILNICGVIPVLGGLAGLAGLVILIIFWVKMAEFKNKLRSMPPAGGMRMSSNPDILD